MHLLPILATLSQAPVGGVFNEMLSLIGIATIVYAFFKGIQLLLPQSAAPRQGAAAPPAARLSPPPATADGLTPEVIAVIAAAVATVTGSSRRIVAIKNQTSLWEKAGRQSILTSHRIR